MTGAPYHVLDKTVNSAYGECHRGQQWEAAHLGASGAVVPMAKPMHYQGDYHVRARQVRMAAYADPRTRCWRCGLTLPECKPHKNGRPARWTAGHLRDSDPDSPLLPECSPCNKSAGASYGNRLRGARRAARKGLTPPYGHTSRRW